MGIGTMVTEQYTRSKSPRFPSAHHGDLAVQRRRVLRVLFCAMVAGLLLAAACDSNSEQLQQTPQVSSLHYIMTTSSTDRGETRTFRQEGYYRAPDSISIVTDDPYDPYREIVVVGSEAWIRDQAGWSHGDAGSVRTLAFATVGGLLGGYLLDGARSGGEGPYREGEATRRYTSSYSGVPPWLTRPLPTCLPSPDLDLLQGDYGLEMLVGKDTGRLYDVIYTVSGTEYSHRSEIVVDSYNEPIEIVPPTGEPQREFTPRPTRCPTD